MDTNVKNLVAQLPAIIANYTQRSHVDVDIQVIYLLKYVKKANASKTNMLYHLEEIEHLLSKKYGERNPNISKHIKQIRQGLDVKMQEMAGTVPSIGNNWNPHNMNQMLGNIICGEGSRCIAVGGRPRTRSESTEPEEIVHILDTNIQHTEEEDVRSETTQPEESVHILDTNIQHAEEEDVRSESTEPEEIVHILDTNIQHTEEEDVRSETTQPEESVHILDTNIQHAEEEDVRRSEMTQLEEIVHIPNTNIKYAEEDNVIYHAGSTDEVRFFEHSMIMLKAIINTDSKDPIEILIPPPKQNIKGKVKKSYTHILDVARETRRLKTENQYLKTMLDNLHQNIIVGQAMSQKEIKAPEGKMSDQTLIELTTYTQKITHRFYDLETELDYIHRRISQLSAMIDGAQGSEAQIPSQERTTKFTAKGRKPRSNHARATPETARSLKLENDLELIASAWRQMKETDRLSEIVGTKLTHENPSIADLSDPSRPTKLAERYSNLYDNQWTDAFTTLSKYYTEASDEKLAGSLYTILVDGYRFCERVRMRQKKNIEDIMLHPDISMEFNLRSEPDTVNDILAKLLSDAAKESSTVSSVNMAQAFIENDEMKNKYGKMMVSCKTYIEECVTLCWLMQVQTPPVCMDLKMAKGQVFQKDTYRHYTSKGIYITFVVWPALFLYKGGPLLAKGVAEGDGKLHKKP